MKTVSWSYLRTIDLKNHLEQIHQRNQQYFHAMEETISDYKKHGEHPLGEYFVEIVEMIETIDKKHTQEHEKILVFITALQEGLLFYEKEIIRLSSG